MASSVLDSSEEKIYGFKLMRLIVDGGTEALRNVFFNIHSGNLQSVLSTHHRKLYSLVNTKKIITQPQWDKLYPHPPKIPNIQEFDITLLVILLRNICGLSPPSTGWDVMPSSADNSREANIVRIKLFRNNFFGHVPGTEVSRLDFEARWVEICSALLGLGLSQAEIDRLKAEECGEEEVNRVRQEWNESESQIISKLEGFEKMLKQVHEYSQESSKQVKSSSNDILSECLHWCDFEKEIQLLLDGYTKGTREWVFEQVSTWLNDKSSNRAFIISAQAGMGKSTIAAAVCKLFPEHFAACHFFQYDNDRYNNPKFLLQSLAWQLCNVFPKYKQNLTHKLSGNKGKVLDDMNIKGLFSMLLEEPFTNIPDPGKQFLIIIDALDESWQGERYEFVDLITNHFHKLPTFIRFLITTRAEKDVERKFHALSPVFLEPNDERNLNDLRLFFEDKLETAVEHISREEFVNNLVENSEGLILYASFVCKHFEDSSIVPNLERLPRGIEEIYESYFNRLESELGNLGMDEEKFLLLLCVISVAKQPLPLELTEIVINAEHGSLSTRRTLQKVITCLSSLLVIKDDCVSFFHKSAKDWLIKPNHRFTIDEKCGHKILADTCVYKMERLKKNEVGFTFELAATYALQYGISHMLQAEIKDMQSLTNLVDCVTDLEIMHASVSIDVYATLNNLASLATCSMYSRLRAKTQAKIKKLVSIIRKFTYILKDIPQSFLPHVVNENDKDLSPKASDLLRTRYRGLAYFESDDEQGSIEKAVIGGILTKDKVLDVDISPSEDFLICGYRNGGLELFSLSDFKSVWKIDDFVVESLERAGFLDFADLKSRCIVFHPFKPIIFPGQLDRVLNLEGKFELGPLMDAQTCAYFTNCCFSHDKRKMATTYGNYFTVWNLLDNTKIVSIFCRANLCSILFSANDRYLATTNYDELCVYGVENGYEMTSQCSFNGYSAVILISTFNLESWYYCKISGLSKQTEIAKYDLTKKPVFKRCWLLPMNARAAAEYQRFIESDDTAWFDKLGHGKFFILGNGSALVFRYHENVLKLIMLTDLTEDSKEISKSDHSSLSSCSISMDGRYIYKSSQYSLEISMLSCSKSIKFRKLVQIKDCITPFVPVANGVFFQEQLRGKHTGNDIFCAKFCATPELWNSEVTQRVSIFPGLTGTTKCFPVAENLIACVMESQVCFFSVLKKEIVARVPLHLPEYILTPYVIACSSQYHVLISDANFTLLLKDKKHVDLNLRVFKKLVPVIKKIYNACFSPNGQLLAFSSDDEDRLYILDTLTLQIRCKLLLHSIRSNMEFVDEQHLLCGGYNNCLCLINIETSSCSVLNCINVVGIVDNRWSFSVCSKTRVVIVYTWGAEIEEFKQIQLWLPNKREDQNEHLGHAGNAIPNKTDSCAVSCRCSIM